MRGSGTDREAARTLEEVDQIRRRVINVVGHELRTPMTTLRGLADQLEAATDEESRRALSGALRRNAARVEQLLDDLLLAAGVSTALPLGDPQPVDLVVAAREAWASLPPPSERELVVEARGGVVASGDPAGVARIFRHLFDNAVKHGTGPVTVRVAQADGRVLVDIESATEGVSAVDLLLAFELFYRGEQAVTTFPGLGIGLTVSRALARQHCGDVELRCGVGEETVVAHLELPVA